MVYSQCWLVVMWLVPRETAAIFCVHHTTCHHFMQSHICRVHVCLAVTCHLHFWQNDQDLFSATAVTWYQMCLIKYYLIEWYFFFFFLLLLYLFVCVCQLDFVFQFVFD